MKTDVVEIFQAPTQDPEFGKKYGITLAASAFAVLLVPVVLLVGYLARTIKHSSDEQPGLPQWDDPKSLALQGGACTLTGLYLLPAAIILAISVITAGSQGSGGFLGISILTAFISLGGLVLGFVGLAFASTGIHSYVHSGNFLDLFHLPTILKKTRAEMSNMGYLFGAIGTVTLLVSVFNGWLGWFGSIFSLLSSAFLSLVMAHGVGVIYGNPATVDNTATAAPQLPSEVAATAKDESVVEEAWDPSSSGDEDGWNPT